MDDVISRQAAIDALGEKPLAWEQGEYEEGLQTQWESDVEAIKALPLTQSEPCEDAVSRKAVIEITAETGALETQYRVKRLPPVTPKQRTGHWIPVGVVEVVGGESAMWGSAIAYHKCSLCHEQALEIDGIEELSEWCPSCGAKMEGEKNEIRT